MANQLKNDPDYKAAWSACLKPWGDESNLKSTPRECLTAALKSGWTIAAIKAFAWCHHRADHYDHVTKGAWRGAVAATANGRSYAEKFLGVWRANPDNPFAVYLDAAAYKHERAMISVQTRAHLSHGQAARRVLR